MFSSGALLLFSQGAKRSTLAFHYEIKRDGDYRSIGRRQKKNVFWLVKPSILGGGFKVRRKELVFQGEN